MLRKLTSFSIRPLWIISKEDMSVSLMILPEIRLFFVFFKRTLVRFCECACSNAKKKSLLRFFLFRFCF